MSSVHTPAGPEQATNYDEASNHDEHSAEHDNQIK